MSLNEELMEVDSDDSLSAELAAEEENEKSQGFNDPKTTGDNSKSTEVDDDKIKENTTNEQKTGKIVVIQTKKKQTNNEKDKTNNDKTNNDETNNDKTNNDKTNNDENKDDKKKVKITFKQYRKMRKAKGGPQSFISYKFWMANGCKDKPNFLDSWVKKGGSKENNNRVRNRDRVRNKEDPEVRRESVTLQKVINVNLYGENSVGVQL